MYKYYFRRCETGFHKWCHRIYCCKELISDYYHFSDDMKEYYKEKYKLSSIIVNDYKKLCESLNEFQKEIKEVNLLNYKSLIENNHCHIATVSKEGYPNLSVASDIKILDNVTILISNNEMINTPDNIENTKNVVITSFNEKWAGLRLSGEGFYYIEGEYFDICNSYFNNEMATPKGAIIVKVVKIESIA